MSSVSFVPIGRLGNLLFEISACIGYAKKYNLKWFVPTRRRHNDTFEGQPTPYRLREFWPNLPFGDIYGERYEQHKPSMFNYAPIPKFDHDVTLVGFFQSEKWFENAKEEVRAAFPLKYYPEYEGYVSIHVRRGDYVTNGNSFPPVDLIYIKDALYKVGVRKVLAFSDDLEWIKFAANQFNQFEWEFNEDTNEYEALSKMASCSHHIIANSTFSWWSAWLGHNPNRIVVSPHYENWFGPGFTGAPPKDLIPDNWTQIKFR